jgi:hypothetical protein
MRVRNFSTWQLKHLGLRTLSIAECIELLKYYKLDIRETSWIDESSHGSVAILFLNGQKIPVWNVGELRNIVDVIESKVSLLIEDEYTEWNIEEKS